MPRAAIAALLLLAPAAGAQSPAPALTRADLEAWLDGYVPGALARNDMAGAVIVVVEGGQVLLQKGYGYADVAAKRLVDPELTLFPVASISKTFTGTAVMQLVEQGKLDLDRDVNAYLDFTIPPAFGAPITLRNLLTHTAGFDDLQKGSSPADPAWYLPLGGYLKRRTPNRIFPPGDTPAYSNYGLGLAAYIVERVSGEPIEQYLERHIFTPLGMHRTSAVQPTPPPLDRDRVEAYLLASGPAQRTEFTNTRGAGGIASTGADMARYMIAHLHDGRYGDSVILEPETARLMHARATSPVEHQNGMALVFFQEDYNGQRVIGHDGDTKGVHSNLKLLLDQDVGLFADFNADGINTAVYDLRDAIFRDFMDRYFPSPVPNEPTVATAREHAALAAGSYEASRRLNGVLSVFMMFNGLEVTANADGTITIPLPPTGERKTFHEIGPFLWREVGGKELLEMRVRDGRVISLHNHPVGILIKVPYWRSAGFNLPILGLSFLVMLVALFLPRTPRVVRVGVAAMVLFLLGWLFLALNLLSHFYLFNAALDPWIRLLHFIGLVGIAGACAAVYRVVLAWRERSSWWRRIGSALLALAMIWVTWFTFAFNLITRTLDY
ncbi:MAG TPA: serine hydrolase domain-containing protein [Gemmatimonadales bacterium]|nr:serine hydrolase domain-containing protein [Gemmatimonadales bacterium]